MNTGSSGKVRVAIIGAGAVSDYHHVPAIKLDPRAELAGACDSDPALLERRKTEWGIDNVTTDPEAIWRPTPTSTAVIIATPNFTHLPISLAAAKHGKHVMAEKPLGVNKGEVKAMYEAVRDAKVVHMTAFTYRFAPSMKYLRHLLKSGALGTPRHFRSQRFLDWPETSWGWRQYKDKAGAGDLFDMTIHRIDFALDLLGPLQSVCGAVARFAPRDKTPDGKPCPPSEVDDWSSIIGEFPSPGPPASGKGRRSPKATTATASATSGLPRSMVPRALAVYRLHEPNTIMLGKTGSDLALVPVPEEFLKPPGSPRDPSQGKPATVFRYDLVWEFVSAIVEGRQAVPSFYDGLSFAADHLPTAVLEIARQAGVGRHAPRGGLSRRSRSVQIGFRKPPPRSAAREQVRERWPTRFPSPDDCKSLADEAREIKSVGLQR